MKPGYLRMLVEYEDSTYRVYEDESEIILGYVPQEGERITICHVPYAPSPMRSLEASEEN